MSNIFDKLENQSNQNKEESSDVEKGNGSSSILGTKPTTTITPAEGGSKMITNGNTGTSASSNPDTANNKVLNHQEQVAADKNDQVVVMDGPLSEIYTKALNMVYAKDKPVLATESQEMMVAMVGHLFLQEDLSKIEQTVAARPDAQYVYATDDESMQSADNLSVAFESLRVATGMKTFKSVRLVLESASGSFCKRSLILLEYAEKMGVKINHKPTAVIESISGSLGGAR